MSSRAYARDPLLPSQQSRLEERKEHFNGVNLNLIICRVDPADGFRRGMTIKYQQRDLIAGRRVWDGILFSVTVRTEEAR